MSTISRLSSRVLLASLATLVVGVGCYNPKITTGNLKCNPDFEPECPDGYVCTAAGRCVTKGTDGGRPEVPVKQEAGMDKPVDMTPPPDLGTDVPCVTMPVAGCTSVPGTCDPLCQTGCNCTQKCSANSKGVLTCNAPTPGTLVKEGRSCDVVNDGVASQTDDCEPGLVCTEVACGVLCARFCRKDADCPNSFCNKALAGGLKVCDVPTVDCDPVKTDGGTSGCPSMTTQACYLSTTIKDRTACDCVTGGKGINGACGVSQDCFPGLACVDAGGTGADFRCKQVCSIAKPECMAGTMCRPFLGSTKFGYCN